MVQYSHTKGFFMIVLLDIDNTLIDFNECARHSIIKIFNDFNLPYSDNVFKSFPDFYVLICEGLKNIVAIR